MRYKAGNHKQPVVVPVFCCSLNAFLRKFEMQQIHHVLRASMAVSTCISKYGSIKAPVTFLFQDRIAPVTLANGSRFLQLFLESSRRMAETHFVNMTPPTILKRQLTQDVRTAIPFSTTDTSFVSGITQRYDLRAGKQDRALPVLWRPVNVFFNWHERVQADQTYRQLSRTFSILLGYGALKVSGLLLEEPHQIL